MYVFQLIIKGGLNTMCEQASARQLKLVNGHYIGPHQISCDAIIEHHDKIKLYNWFNEVDHGHPNPIGTLLWFSEKVEAQHE